MAQLLQYIMFCAGVAFWRSLVHWTENMVVDGRFMRITSIFTTLYIYEVVNIYEVHVDSMRHFVMHQVNK
jgi:hypothetical protein